MNDEWNDSRDGVRGSPAAELCMPREPLRIKPKRGESDAEKDESDESDERDESDGSGESDESGESQERRESRAVRATRAT